MPCAQIKEYGIPIPLATNAYLVADKEPEIFWFLFQISLGSSSVENIMIYIQVNTNVALVLCVIGAQETKDACCKSLNKGCFLVVFVCPKRSAYSYSSDFLWIR